MARSNGCALALSFVVACAAPPPATDPASVSAPGTARPSEPVAAPRAWRPVGVRVVVVRYGGALPQDEAGAWDPRSADDIVANLGAGARETGLTFTLERVVAVDVRDERLSRIATTVDFARAATLAYVASGVISNEVLDVVVVSPEPSTFVGGWGETDAPLRTPGRWPVITVNTRVARNREPHWITHELGHVLGFYDATYYGTTSVVNAPYTRCGLRVASTTYPIAMAPRGARENFMSYDVTLRRSFFTEGYEEDSRKVIGCWARTSGL